MVGVPGTEHTYRIYITYSEYFANPTHYQQITWCSALACAAAPHY